MPAALRRTGAMSKTTPLFPWKPKKKKALFGADIEPSCSYCRHNGGKEGEVLCTVHCEMADGKCKKYQYDPLMREPRSAPPLRTAQYNEEDFKL